MPTPRKKSLRTRAHMKLLRLLIKRRRPSALTQADVANKLGWVQSDVSKVENGERRLNVVELSQMGQAISFDVSELVAEIQLATVDSQNDD